MAVFRLLITGILLSRELSRVGATQLELPYEATALATRPIPTGLRIYQHPREISRERAREITGGRVCE